MSGYQNPGSNMMLSRKDQHNKLFDLFVREMFVGDTPKPASYKPKSALCSTRQKFLNRIREQAKRDPGVI